MGRYTRIGSRREFNYSFLGGVLIALVGLGSIIASMGLLGVGAIALGSYQNVFIFTAVAFLIAGFITVLGGFSAMMQQSWYFGIIGGIAGIFSPGLFCSIISVIGLIIVLASKKEFFRHVSMYDRKRY